MSEWDKLNQWEKARITKYIMYGNMYDSSPRGPMSEGHKENLRKSLKKHWVNLPPEVREKRLKQLASARREFLANFNPEAHGEAIKKSWAKLTPEERKARVRATVEGKRKARKRRQQE